MNLSLSRHRLVLLLFLTILLWHLYSFLPIIFHTRYQDIGELKIYDRHEQLITHLPQPDGFQISLGNDEPITENITRAFLRVEDERFYSHWGVNAPAKLRALRDNISAGQIVSGGSTITEQYLKNKYFPHSRRSVVQKLREATLALYTSIFIDKDTVLRNYLDTIYFGNRNYGIKAAMKAYFDKSHLETVTDAELVTLLAIIRSPGVINTDEKHFRDRFARIAANLDLPDLKIPELSLNPFRGFNKFPHVTELAKQSNQTHTSIDSSLQTKAKELIELSLTRLSGKNVSNAAIYVVKPDSGDILVWQGSKDFYDNSIDGQVNVITQRRQMGSALKPFIYLYAFSQGAHPDQLIVDLEKDFQTAKLDEFYRPLNYGLREGGVMPLKIALANSFNIASVRLLDHLGLQNTYNFLKDLGLDFDNDAYHYGLSLALGSPDLTMKSVADAYAGLAKIDSIAKFHLFQTLSNPLNRSRSFGSNSILNSSIPFAVKTGTTKNFHDNWTFGYHPDLVVATWVGNNDNSPMIDVDGITGAGPIWHRMVEAAIAEGYMQSNSKFPPAAAPAGRHGEIPDPLIQSTKCLNASCVRTELIYQEPGREWLSDLESGHYCLEDFFIRNIEEEEIVKMAKIFNFQDFSISWCLKDTNYPNDSNAPFETDLQILKPEHNETFYIRRDIPLELQEIILKANREAEWFVDEERVGYEKIIFIQPTQGKHKIKAKTSADEETVEIEINWADS